MSVNPPLPCLDLECASCSAAVVQWSVYSCIRCPALLLFPLLLLLLLSRRCLPSAPLAAAGLCNIATARRRGPPHCTPTALDRMWLAEVEGDETSGSGAATPPGPPPGGAGRMVYPTNTTRNIVGVAMLAACALFFA